MRDDPGEELRRKPVELNLAAAKRRKSGQTGYIHHRYESLPGEPHDTIPLYENFCYTLALLRSRLSEHILEAKALLEKLMAFEVGGNFPLYLHEYPECKDRTLSLHLIPIFFWILHDFRSVMGEAIGVSLERLMERMLIHAERSHSEKEISPRAWVKWKAYAAPHTLTDLTFTTAAEWGDYLVALQVAQARGIDVQRPLNRVCALWSSHCHAFLGFQFQEKREPAVTLLDLFFGCALQSFAHRACNDHPVHLQAALVHPISFPSFDSTSSPPFVHFSTEDPRQGYVAFWGNQKMTHSLTCDHHNSVLHAKLLEHSAELFVTLPQGWAPSEEPEVSLKFFCNLAESNSVQINGKKGTTFHLGDHITICSEDRQVRMQFFCEEGDGVFFGHLLWGNRPNQRSCLGQYRFDAYDWQLAIRTVRRSSSCKLSVKVNTLMGSDVATELAELNMGQDV